MYKKLLNFALLLIFSLTFSTTYSQCVIADYSFNGNALDSESSYDGLIVGATTTANCAQQNNMAYQFDGVDDYIELNNNNPIITTTEFSIHVVARIDGAGGGDDGTLPLFVQRDDAVLSNGGLSSIVFFAQNINDNVAFVIRGSASNGLTDKITYPSPTDGDWHCYTAVCDADSLRLFFDGVEVAKKEKTLSGNFFTSIDHVEVGKHAYSGVATQGVFNGAIDQLTIYDCRIVPTITCCTNDTTTTPISNISANYSGTELYPNPSTGDVKLSNLTEGTSVKVFNLLGVEVFQSNCISSSEFEFKLDEPSGLYLVELSNEKQRFLHKLTIK